MRIYRGDSTLSGILTDLVHLVLADWRRDPFPFDVVVSSICPYLLRNRTQFVWFKDEKASLKDPEKQMIDALDAILDDCCLFEVKMSVEQLKTGCLYLLNELTDGKHATHRPCHTLRCLQ